MMDLKSKGLPNAIEAYGEPFLLDTDFRVWIDFSEKLSAALNGDEEAYGSFFIGAVPYLTQEVVDGLEAFYKNQNELPRDVDVDEPLVDLNIDSDYIFAAFWQAYGIDLTVADLHWHKFSALLNALPQDTMFINIVGYRSYEGEDKDSLEQRARWSLPRILTEEEKKATEEFNALFG